MITILFILVEFFSQASVANDENLFPSQGDININYKDNSIQRDYEKKEIMIPMRDGVQLYTLIFIPKSIGNQNTKSPILMTRTPYNASSKDTRNNSTQLANNLPVFDEIFIQDNYIRVYQDTRGKNKSNGNYVLTMPQKGPLNPTTTDHSTDTYDTIDYLIKNIKESNGNVGLTGCSYEGFTAALGLIQPHKALKAVAPVAPMTDGWMGDDWFQNGVFRQNSLNFFVSILSAKGFGPNFPKDTYDDFEYFKNHLSAGHFAKIHGLDQLPFWQRVFKHPHYDIFWQEQAIDKILIKNPTKIPTLWINGLWDQDDIYGAINSYQGLIKKGFSKNNFLLLGPWNHCQVLKSAYNLGSLKFNGDTAEYARSKIIKPFFDKYLKNESMAKIPPITLYNTGTNTWETYQSYPTYEKLTPIYFDNKVAQTLSWDKPKNDSSLQNFDEYISEPNKPVPNFPRPIRFDDKDVWSKWLTMDQRFAQDRPDVLVYETNEIDKPIQISGIPKVNLYVSTSETDADFVVKLIDVYPHTDSKNEMNGYQLPLSIQIFRARYYESKSHPKALEKDKIYKLEFDLSYVHHQFQKGHKIMVQIQSSLFPLYDRNPQMYVENPFEALAEHYKKAKHKIYKDNDHPSGILLPISLL